MIRATFLSLSLVACVSTAAKATDCLRPGTAVDRTICGDPLLKKVDDQLEETVSERLASLGPDRRETLVEDQAAWRSNRGCAGTGDDADNCLLNGVADRRAYLDDCFPAKDDGKAPTTLGRACTYYLRHSACGTARIVGPAFVRKYAFVVRPEVEAASRRMPPGACAAGGRVDYETTFAVRDYRPGYLFLERVHEDGDASRVETMTAYSTPLGREATVADVFGPATDDVVRTVASTEGHPESWSSTDQGGLVLYFPVRKGEGTAFTSVPVPRKDFASKVAPRYLNAFKPQRHVDLTTNPDAP